MANFCTNKSNHLVTLIVKNANPNVANLIKALPSKMMTLESYLT